MTEIRLAGTLLFALLASALLLAYLPAIRDAMFLLGAALGLHRAWLERHQVGASGADWDSYPSRALPHRRTYLGMLVPMIGIVQAGGQAMADRYTYLPLYGLFLAAAWSLPGPEAFQRLQGAATSAAILVVTLLTIAAALQAGRWRDSETLFRHSFAVTEDNWLVQNKLGLLLADRGSFEEDAGHFREALRIRCREALRLRPDSPETRRAFSIPLMALGRTGGESVR